jgi:hypothetical protein
LLAQQVEPQLPDLPAQVASVRPAENLGVLSKQADKEVDTAEVAMALIIIEEATLMALAQAREGAPDAAAVKTLSRAQAARTARLLELRVAAAKVVTVGEYYKLRTRSARATYGGIACSLIGIAAIVAAFSWPIF